MNSTRSSYNFFWYIIDIANVSFLVSFIFLFLADFILSEHNGLDRIWTCADRHYVFNTSYSNCIIRFFKTAFCLYFCNIIFDNFVWLVCFLLSPYVFDLFGSVSKKINKRWKWRIEKSKWSSINRRVYSWQQMKEI